MKIGVRVVMGQRSLEIAKCWRYVAYCIQDFIMESWSGVLSQVIIDKGMKDGQKITFRGESNQVSGLYI